MDEALRLAYLAAMEIPVWVLRGAADRSGVGDYELRQGLLAACRDERDRRAAADVEDAHLAPFPPTQRIRARPAASPRAMPSATGLAVWVSIRPVPQEFVMKLNDLPKIDAALAPQAISTDVLLEKYAKGTESSAEDIHHRVSTALAAR